MNKLKHYRLLVAPDYKTRWHTHVICTCDDPEKQKLCKYYKPHPKAEVDKYYRFCFRSYDNRGEITDECMLSLKGGFE